VNEAPLTPDFIPHDWMALASAELADGFVTMSWPDGTSHAVYTLWLAENAEGYGLEPLTRESMLEPRYLPSPTDATSASVDADGALLVSWNDGRTVRVHPGWLRHIADESHLPACGLPAHTLWTTADIPRADESLRVFAEMARDPRFQLASAFRPGDLVSFDNRRVLHGRDAFERNGARHLRGCCADHDDVNSRLRVLRRGRSPIDRSPTSPTNEVPA